MVVLLGVALTLFAIFDVSTYGNIGVGWTLDGVNFLGGSLRMLFPFSLGMLLSRNFKPVKVKGAFWICTLVLRSTQICKFLGDISYPIYVIHYPLMYLFYAWLIKNQLYTLGETWQVALCVYALCIVLAYLSLKFYDEPLRKYLAKRFLSKKR